MKIKSSSSEWKSLENTSRASPQESCSLNKAWIAVPDIDKGDTSVLRGIPCTSKTVAPLFLHLSAVTLKYKAQTLSSSELGTR